MQRIGALAANGKASGFLPVGPDAFPLAADEIISGFA